MHQIKNQAPLDVYTIVTNRIIELLEKGVIPWQKPWTEAGIPKNLITGKNYRGINVWLLNSLNYAQNSFLTFKQVQDLSASIKKGEKANLVVFWKWLEKENKETKEVERIPLLRYYNVFNIDQCTGIPKEKLLQVIEQKIDPIEACEKIITEMPKRPDIRYDEQRAYYNRLQDYVNLPRTETFKTSEAYYGTLFHELVHSTGHSDRLNRRELLDSKGFNTQDYAIEELTAEMGSSYLKSYAGIPIEQLDNNAAYIHTWLERLKIDKRFIVHSSSQAQKATDFILKFSSEEKEFNLISDMDLEKNTDKEEELKEIRSKEKEKSAELER